MVKSFWGVLPNFRVEFRDSFVLLGRLTGRSLILLVLVPIILGAPKVHGNVFHITYVTLSLFPVLYFFGFLIPFLSF